LLFFRAARSRFTLDLFKASVSFQKKQEPSGSCFFMGILMICFDQKYFF